jgi:putative membrane protein
MTTEKIIRTATFNPKVCTYWILVFTIVLFFTVVGIPFLLLWIPLSLYFTKRYLDRMECVLTERDLKVKKGLFVRVEKTIPLEKITDLGLVQGPIMRRMGLHQLSVETAGQSAPGSLVSLTGINDVEDFREAVLNQRDQIRTKPASSSVALSEPPTGDSELLREISATLVRIEGLLKK